MKNTILVNGEPRVLEEWMAELGAMEQQQQSQSTAGDSPQSRKMPTADIPFGFKWATTRNENPKKQHIRDLEERRAYFLKKSANAADSARADYWLDQAAICQLKIEQADPSRAL